MPRPLALIAELGRISNLPTVWTNLLAGWILGGGTLFASGVDWLQIGFLGLGGSLVYWGGMALNDFADARWDREHGKDRPIPRGDISRTSVGVLAMAALLCGGTLLVFGGRAPLPWVVALLVAIIVYDFFHKPWAGSVLFMGACRVFLVLVGASAVAGVVSPEQITLLRALGLGAYIVGVTLVARGEDGADRRWRLLGTILLFAPLALSLVIALNLKSPSEMVFTGLILVAVAAWISVPAFARDMIIPRRIGHLLAGIVLVDALAVAPTEPYLALLFAVAAPALLLWQRWVAAS